mmetsp:Transcript_32730/g.32084  ORF Transcript_32730/g.32084 Transcript_32730/m.32084 type:complete len:257 (+) Transcript_32730:1547-2317(+)
MIEPGFTQEGWYIFREGEKARYIYFLISGKAGYAIESQNPFIYISIKEEEMFGNTDLLRTNVDKRGNYMRKFSVLAVETCETAKLSLENLVSVKEHFPQVYDDIFNKSDVLFKRINALKKRSIEMILHQDSSQKITDKNGIQIPIHEYKEKVDKNVPVEDAIDLNNVENLEMSDLSEYSDDDSGAGQQKVKSGLSAMISKIRKKETSGESKVSKLEKKINKLDQKFETLREEIKSDMKAMLEQYLGKANNPEAEGE